MTAKVFCIGFHKTGTKSLTAALGTLGYRVTGPNGVRDPDIATKVLDLANALVPKYDAFQDNPWPIIYREMDARYPGSKFILTLRDRDAWIRSQVNHFGTEVTPMRQWIYGEHAGFPAGNEDIYLARYDRHNAEVREYFAHRPDDLLVMPIDDSADWEPLCRFLGRPIPDVPFPHRNKGSDRQVRRERGEGPPPHLGLVDVAAPRSTAGGFLRRLLGRGR
ncbi:hypothetical protein J421_6050 (plasmid) [Gemmatirosa kalamazoonensis]|uniref:Sulfotransferase family protein n=1 Tax=Gemmatirosa kalamazoonensis TaxID=861299 RepID=W0RTD4_9BACT|nr:sulfotransferase family protein [Gemmatirosa kalamazoonensis]AHG93585.1 hypothetical protein J421_6050 [Gemmatirosa kalamazoonensis]